MVENRPAAGADAGARRHVRRLRRRHRLDDLHLVHQEPALPRLRDRSGRLAPQYVRLFGNDAWTTSLKNLVVLALGSALAIVFGFILAAMVEREKRGEGFFRTVFLYPLAISLIVTGLVWRWMFNPSLGIEAFLHGLGLESASFNWLAKPDTAMYAHHPRLDLARARLLHGADARRA